MVLAAIAMLSMIVVEFVFDTNINYKLAVNEKNRLQAYYLAKSAVNLMKLEMKFDKAYRSMLSGSAASQYISGNIGGPLCKQIPMSTALLRGVFAMAAAEEGAPPTELDTETEAKIEKTKESMVTSFGSDAAKDFLAFDGDFEGECEDEQTKFNLSVFAGLDPSQQALTGTNSYDTFKQILVQFLSSEKYKDLFGERRDDDVKAVVKNIADWVDKNSEINEIGGGIQGQETNVYKEMKEGQKIKNTKFLTLDELFLVEGVNDDWFTTLKDEFTIYGDNKINVCQASDDVVSALILQYVGSNPNIPPVAANNKEKIDQLVNAVKNACVGASPQPQQIAQALDQALGVTSSGQTSGTSLPGQPPQTGQQTPAAGTSNSFASMITSDSRFFSMKGNGMVGSTDVVILTVIDANGANPKAWKTLYWKVE